MATKMEMATPAPEASMTTARVLDGKACSREIEAELKQEIEAMRVAPRLVLVLVGNDASSKTYIRLKKAACTRVGISVEVLTLDEDTTLASLLRVVHTQNEDDSVHGVLVQLPLPAPLASHEHEVLHAITPAKDVDGLHPAHFYRLPRPQPAPSSTADPLPLLEPCTPAGCLELLRRHAIDVAGQDVVVIGRGQLVGLPLALLLMAHQATVTVCHSQTKQLADKVARADIVVAAAGVPQLVQGQWLKPGAVVVDVGINYVDDAQSPRGYVIHGDVQYDAACARAAAITPVPGGIGPMTIAMLLRNTVRAAATHASATTETDA